MQKSSNLLREGRFSRWCCSRLKFSGMFGLSSASLPFSDGLTFKTKAIKSFETSATIQRRSVTSQKTLLLQPNCYAQSLYAYDYHVLWFIVSIFEKLIYKLKNLQICRFVSLLSFLLRQSPFLVGNETLLNKLRRKGNTSTHGASSVVVRRWQTKRQQ